MIVRSRYNVSGSIIIEIILALSLPLWYNYHMNTPNILKMIHLQWNKGVGAYEALKELGDLKQQLANCQKEVKATELSRNKERDARVMAEDKAKDLTAKLAYLTPGADRIPDSALPGWGYFQEKTR